MYRSSLPVTRKIPSWFFGLLVVVLLGTQIASQSHALDAELHDQSCSLCHSVADAESPPSAPPKMPLTQDLGFPVASDSNVGESGPHYSYTIRGPPKSS